MRERFIRALQGKAKPLDIAVLEDDIRGEDYPYVIKLDGQLADDPAAFILANYGAALSWRRADPHPDGQYIFRLVGFYEREGGSATLWAYCIDRELQEGLPGKPMIRWWPDAPRLGEILPPASAWFDSGIVAYVKEDGVADWGVGRGEAYFPTTGSGVCAVWVCSLDGPSDIVEHWGWLDGTAYRQLCPIFERVLVEEEEPPTPPPPPPEPGDLGEVVEALQGIEQSVTHIARYWPMVFYGDGDT